MRLNNYLHSQLAISFFPIFLGLFFITSMVFLVKIASLTSIITMNFFELFKLFSYSIPQIIFYTLPITFFISLAITLSKLSSEYELTVITSFGLNPERVLRIFFPITFILTILLLVISVALIPKTKYLSKQFIEIKKKESNFNIKESEFGQKFGDWLIYIDSKENNKFKNLKLFQAEKDKDQFVISKEAELNNEKGFLSFRLDDGVVYIMDNKELNQIEYDKLYINDSLADTKADNFTNTYDYWISNFKNNKDIDDFTFFILTSIFPLISLFFVITFGYFNPRYEKNKTVAYSILTVVIYYVLMKYIADRLLLHALYIIPLVWLVSSYVLYSRTIKKEY
ncbi:LptF/LptG family permease [Arcobacter vandammei]|uniref:LptF/LptG family permease n=1 Tax=Arcobacter vandammei TaxID=2782243 RepID=UPI0018DF426D|nr:LptF/LptG family permease [Arcobacter vandammei]